MEQKNDARFQALDVRLRAVEPATAARYGLPLGPLRLLAGCSFQFGNVRLQVAQILDVG